MPTAFKFTAFLLASITVVPPTSKVPFWMSTPVLSMNNFLDPLAKKPS